MTRTLLFTLAAVAAVLSGCAEPEPYLSTANTQAMVLPGQFSISATRKVQFSKGNLKYSVTDEQWSFFDRQYDCNTSYVDSEVSLFTWGYDRTRSKNPKSVKYSTEFTDWGEAFGEESIWRTLTIDEWTYLIQSRGIDITKAMAGVTVCGRADCMVLAPDDNNELILDSYDEQSWAEAEAKGFVCLPPSGQRYGISINYTDYLYYWSSTSAADDTAYLIRNEKVEHTRLSIYGKQYGACVRLVTDVK